MQILQGILIYLTVVLLFIIFMQASKYNSDKYDGKATREQLYWIHATIVTTVLFIGLTVYALTK